MPAALNRSLGQQVQVDLDASEVDYRVPTLRRGLLEVGPLTVNRIGLFGLAMTSRAQGQVDHVRVLPRLIPVRELARGRRRSAVGADESVEHGGTDLVGLHEYVPGDDLRRLHWATSARTGSTSTPSPTAPRSPLPAPATTPPASPAWSSAASRRTSPRPSATAGPARSAGSTPAT